MYFHISKIRDSKQTSANEEREHLPNGKGTDLQKLENLKFWTPLEKELPSRSGATISHLYFSLSEDD